MTKYTPKTKVLALIDGKEHHVEIVNVENQSGFVTVKKSGQKSTHDVIATVIRIENGDKMYFLGWNDGQFTISDNSDFAYYNFDDYREYARNKLNELDEVIENGQRDLEKYSRELSALKKSIDKIDKKLKKGK